MAAISLQCYGGGESSHVNSPWHSKGVSSAGLRGESELTRVADMSRSCNWTVHWVNTGAR